MACIAKHNRNDRLGQSLFTAARRLGPSSSHGGGLRTPFLLAHQRWCGILSGSSFAESFCTLDGLERAEGCTHGLQTA
jgi:hypothetical protein